MTAISSVQFLLDAMLDAAEAATPDADYSIVVTAENSLLVPVQSTVVEGSADSVDGAYRGHVYRGCMVWTESVLDYLVIVQPVVGRFVDESRALTYFGDLRTGTFGMEPPPPAD